jgi:hypothetical protein
MLPVHACLPGGFGEVALGAGQHVAQVVALEVLDDGLFGLGEGQVRAQGQLGPRALRLEGGPELLEGAGPRGQGEGALQHVAQLAHIAGPGVA